MDTCRLAACAAAMTRSCTPGPSDEHMTKTLRGWGERQWLAARQYASTLQHHTNERTRQEEGNSAGVAQQGRPRLVESMAVCGFGCLSTHPPRYSKLHGRWSVAAGKGTGSCRFLPPIFLVAVYCGAVGSCPSCTPYTSK